MHHLDEAALHTAWQVLNATLLEVAQELAALVALYLSVLHWAASKGLIQLHCLVGSYALLIAANSKR